MMKKVVVDVDGTLVDFHTPLHKLLLQLYPEIPEVIPMKDWNWYKEFITDKQFHATCDIVHQIQMRSHAPMGGALSLFITLKIKEAEVFVASHRKSKYAPSLARWLAKYHLEPYSLVYAGNDKLPLITEGCIVIDDAPKTIEYARSVGAKPVWLTWPWNEHIKGGYRNLFEVADAVSKML